MADGDAKAEAKQSGDDESSHDEKPKQNDKPDKKPRWPWFLGAGIALLFIAVVLYFVLVPQPVQYTNDAYVQAHFATVASRVPGQVTEVLVEDNQPVHAGQVLVVLDDRDLKASLAQAEAVLASDRARVSVANAQAARQPALIRQAQAQIDSVNARLDLGRAQVTRYTNLASTGAGTVQQRQEADVTLRQDRASMQSAQAQLDAAREQLKALEAETEAARTRVAVDEAQVAQAQLSLSYTRITAEIDGVLTQRSIQVGNYIAPGTPLMVIVPLDAIYVTANYREPALRHMRPGQHARIHVDAYDIDLDGVVDSLPPASGAVFSPIPPNNATGNFTKIVQRLPVKIVFAPNQKLVKLVRVGMSVEAHVETRLEDLVGEQRGSDRRVNGWDARP